MSTKRDEIIASMARKLGVDAAKVDEVLHEQEQDGNVRLSTAADPIADGLRGSETLGRYVTGKAPYAEVPAAFTACFSGVGRRAELYVSAPGEEQKAPKLEGLPEGLAGVIVVTTRVSDEGVRGR